MGTKFNNGGKDTIQNWDTTALTNSKNMFNGAAAFNQPIPYATPKWKTTAVTDMEGMFQGAKIFNQELKTWDTKAVKNMKNMFNGAEAFIKEFAVTFPACDVSAVTSMEGMFQG